MARMNTNVFGAARVTALLVKIRAFVAIGLATNGADEYGCFWGSDVNGAPRKHSCIRGNRFGYQLYGWF